MHALVAGASPEPEGEAFYREKLAGADFVVAADAGGEWCMSLGRIPDLTVGDFDSAAPGALRRLRSAGIDVAEYPAEKDESDLDLAVAAAIARGADSVTLTACSGGRLDHTLASVGSLLRAGGDGTADLQEPSFAAWTVGAGEGAGIELESERGSVFSVFAIGEARGVAITGGMFPLTAAPLPSLSSLGLSNVVSASRIIVSAATGTLVVIVQVTPGHPRPVLISAS